MDIAAWLRELGLERYVDAFRENEIDAEILPKLTANDLKDIGVTTVGHRRKLLEAITALTDPALAPQAGPNAPARAAPRARPAEAERRQLTVMLVDLVGSTELSAKLDPEDMAAVIRAYQECCAQVVERWGGHVAKYMGDGVLAYFGWPQAHEDDPERSVRAGMALTAAVGALTTPGGDPLAARVGVATGLVMVGDLIGEGAAQEDAVVGETPNLAARLQGLARPGAVVVASETRRLLRGIFDLDDLGEHELKGFERLIAVWRVAGEAGSESRFEAHRAQRLTPLIGRDDEVEILIRRWRRARQGEGQVVLITGEPGIGKSRLAATLRESIDQEPHTRLTYQCSPHHTDSAFHPVIRQLEHAAGIRPEQGPAERLDRLEMLLRPSSDALEEQVALLASLLAIPTDGRHPASQLGAQELKERTFRALDRQLEGLATVRPVLLMFEDLHWADPSTLELLDRLVGQVESLPVLVLLTARSGLGAAWSDQAHVTMLALNRIGKRETRALLKALVGENSVPEDLIEEIVVRSDGIPLFAEEMARAVLETRAGGGSADGRRRMKVPVSLQDSLMARLDRLTTGKPVAQMAAAVGRDFTPAMIEPICDLARPDLDRALDELVGAGVLNRRGGSPEPSYFFKHALVQDAAYDSLLRGKRRQLHRRIAEALGARLVDQPAMLAHHWECAQDVEQALECRLQAGRLAAVRFAVWESGAQYWRALKLLQQLPESEDTRRHHLATLLELIKLGEFWHSEADRTRALRYIDYAIEIAIDSGSASALARLKAYKGNIWQDESLLVEAARHAADAGDERVKAEVAGRYSGYHGVRGHFEESLGYIELAIEIYAGLGADIQQGRLMAANGRCYSARAGRLERSFHFAARARAIAEATGDLPLRSWLAMEAEPCFYKGLWQRTVDIVEQGLPPAWEIGNWSVILWCSAWAAIAEIKLGYRQSARLRIEEALKTAASRTPDFLTQAYPLIALGQVHLAEGEAEAAMEVAQRASEMAALAEARLEQGAAHRLLAQIHQARDDRQEAEAEHRRSLEILGAIQSRPELAQSLLAYGRFRSADDPVDGRRLLEQALALFEDMDAIGWLEETHAALDA
jgi:class 3 adenylate cyclase/tetratricopeptide (TPR) repeat protein